MAKIRIVNTDESDAADGELQATVSDVEVRIKLTIGCFAQSFPLNLKEAEEFRSELTKAINAARKAE